MDTIGFYFTANGTTLQLPVNPEALEITYKGNNKTAEIVKLGQVNLLKRKALATIKFDSFFPEQDWFPAIVANTLYPPETYKTFFLSLMENAEYCRLVVTGIDLSMLVSIESFAPKNQAGDFEDTYYSISLKEYRPFGIQELVYDVPLGGTNKGTPTRPSSSPTVGSTVIVNGKLHYTSYGDGPGKTLKDYKGKINYINKDGSKQYHVTTPEGDWLGWVEEKDIKVVN